MVHGEWSWMSEIIDFLKDYRVILLIVLVIASIVSISTLGIQQGLDFEGGSLIQIHLEQPVDQETMNTVTGVLDKRLNLFGVQEVSVRASGNQDVIVSIAGVKPDQVTNLIGKPGKFEAKIENQTVFTGADITSVQPYQIIGTEAHVPFSLSFDGARKFAAAAKGKAGTPVDMYLDNQLITSPEIDEGVATGTPVTNVEIKIPASSKEEAKEKAKETQTILQSGSLPVQVNIAGVSSVSAELGDQFREGALIAGLFAIIIVSIIIFLRYKNPMLVIPIIFTSLAELLLILGAASVIHWTIDLAAIAGIIAAIGTGVDDQLIITDETLEVKSPENKKTSQRSRRSRKRSASLRMRIKGAFFIVFAAAATLIAAMLPLAYIGFTRGTTGIGFMSGFAVTTIIGVLVGIFITRPVYAKFIERFVVTE